MFIRWPNGELTGGQDVDTLCAHIDVFNVGRALCLGRCRASDRDGESLKSILYGDKILLRQNPTVHSQRVKC